MGRHLKSHQEFGDIVETASLAYVTRTSFIPNVNIDSDVFAQSLITDLQFEAIALAVKSFETKFVDERRCGFFIG